MPEAKTTKSILNGNWKKWIAQGGLVAAMTALFTFLINLQQEWRADYQIILDRQERSIERLELKVTTLEEVISDQDKRLAILSSLNYETPVATWFKDLQGRMVTLNRAYESYFLRPIGKDRYDYIGKTDAEFWEEQGSDQGHDFWKEDLEVITTGRVKRFVQTIELESGDVRVIVNKYPVYSTALDRQKEIVGVGGAAMIIDVD